MVDFINDPLPLIIESAMDIKPDLQVYVQFNPQMGRRKKGSILFSSDYPGVLIVDINARIPYQHVPEILAHELAHAIRGQNEGHTKEWRATFEDIHRRYEEKLKVQMVSNRLAQALDELGKLFPDKGEQHV